MVVAFYNAPWGSIYFLIFSRFDLVGDCHFTILQTMIEYLILLIHIVPNLSLLIIISSAIRHPYTCYLVKILLYLLFDESYMTLNSL